MQSSKQAHKILASSYKNKSALKNLLWETNKLFFIEKRKYFETYPRKTMLYCIQRP